MHLNTFAPLVIAALCSLACSNEEVVWPIANSADADADEIRSPFGPRDQSGSHDFHAGVDFAVAEGTKVRAIKAGTVEKTVVWEGGTGPGNWVLLDHGDGEKSAYLHLSRISVDAGDAVDAGDKIGRSGSSGTASAHLHLNYMLGVHGQGADEGLAHNVLELLPHSDMPTPGVTFTDTGVTLDLVLRPMTIQALTLEGEGQGESLSVDYAEVVAKGNPERDEPTQFGVHLSVGDGEAGRFTLTLTPEPPLFVPQRVLAYDYAGEVVLDASR